MINVMAGKTKNYTEEFKKQIVALQGNGNLSFLVLVIVAIMMVGLCRLPISFCKIITGLMPPCSLPTVGFRSA